LRRAPGRALSAAVLAALGGGKALAAGFPAQLQLSDLNSGNGFAIPGKATGDYSGRSVSGAGDINGDGVDDLIVGADRADPNGSYSGESYVVFGSSGGFPAQMQLSDLNGGNGFAIPGKATGDNSGLGVFAAGDINGDGLDDFVMGALGADPNGRDLAGESYVIFGRQTPTPPLLDHYLFYVTKPSKGSPKFQRFGPIRLADQFGAWNFDVARGNPLGLPADKNNEGVTDAVTHLFEYPVTLSKQRPKQRFQPVRNVQIWNQCNDLTLEVKRPRSLLLPTNKDLGGPPLQPDPANHNVDHFLCYDVKVQKTDAAGNRQAKFPKGIQVEVTDQFQSRRYDLKKITKLCNPVDKSGDPLILSGKQRGDPFPITPAAIRNPDAHLVCYRATVAKRFIEQQGCGPLDPTDKGVPIDPPQAKHTPVAVFTANQFESGQSTSKKAVEFCIPSTKNAPNP